jgi:hypothetical protein
VSGLLLPCADSGPAEEEEGLFGIPESTDGPDEWRCEELENDGANRGGENGPEKD